MTIVYETVELINDNFALRIRANILFMLSHILQILEVESCHPQMQNKYKHIFFDNNCVYNLPLHMHKGRTHMKILMQQSK